jgi:hypothetical protein
MSGSKGIRFEHQTGERNDGKTTLVVTPVSGVVRDPAIIADQSRSYAEAYANRTCPKGYNFYGDGPLGGSRKGVHTYVFQCNQ